MKSRFVPSTNFRVSTHLPTQIVQVPWGVRRRSGCRGLRADPANYTGAGTARSEWIKFADWVEETYGVDIGGLPGTALGATDALEYMDEYIG